MKLRRLSLPWCSGDGDNGGKGKRPPKTINIFMGFFFMVNLCLGTGFLGIPYSFFYAGYLAAIPSLLIVGFVSWINSVWLLEVMARAQVRNQLSVRPAVRHESSNHTSIKNSLSQLNVVKKIIAVNSCLHNYYTGIIHT